MKIRHIRALLLLMMAACVLPIQAQDDGGLRITYTGPDSWQ